MANEDADLAVAMALSAEEARIHQRFHAASTANERSRRAAMGVEAGGVGTTTNSNSSSNNNNTFSTMPAAFHGSQQERDEEDVRVARIMFFAGCCLLPWLWIASLLYFRKRILDKDAPMALRMCE